jgi:hypothetical protein
MAAAMLLSAGSALAQPSASLALTLERETKVFSALAPAPIWKAPPASISLDVGMEVPATVELRDP